MDSNIIFLAFGIGPLGGVELLVISLVVLVFFGSKRIHVLSRGIARAPLEFFKGRNENRPKSEVSDNKKNV
jgi:Sec-independent protein translocase protein TatA